MDTMHLPCGYDTTDGLEMLAYITATNQKRKLP
jgi:hypothetical protein